MKIISVLFIPFLMATEVEPLVTTSDPLTVVRHQWEKPAKSEASVNVDLTLQLLPGHHAYVDKLQVFSLLPDGAQVQGVTPHPVVQFVDFAGKNHQGLENEFHIKFKVKLPSDVWPVDKLQYDVNYIACTPKFCLPPKFLTVVIPVSTSKSSFIGQLKGPLSGRINIEEQISENLFLAYLLVFLFGVLASLTPCIYPLIPITLAIIGSRAREVRRYEAFLLSVIYVHGIATTYSILGIIAARTGALFGQVLSYPGVGLVFALLFFAMGFSLFGLFEIRAPHFLSQRLSQRGQSGGYVGAYVSGLVAGVIASPCVGPMLVSILAYIAKTQSVTLGFTLLFTFAMGMGMLLIAVGTFSSLVRSLPKSGSWMTAIKVFLGSIMISVGSYYAYIAYDELTASHGIENTSVKYKNGWETFSEQKVEQAKAQGRPVIIDFYADWCAACVELDHKTFVDSRVIEKTKGFVLLRVDATESFKGLSDLQKKYNVFGLPTVVCLSSKGELQKDLSLLGFEESGDFIHRLEKCKAR